MPDDLRAYTVECNRKGKRKPNLCVSSLSSLLVLAVTEYFYWMCFAHFSYRLPVNINNYTEKGQRKSIGNGHCTGEKSGKQRPDDILVAHLISFFYHQNYQFVAFSYCFLQ